MTIRDRSREAPPRKVLEAFGLKGTAVPLTGGEGRSWRVGSAVLKPVDMSQDQLDWQAALYVSLQGESGFRVPAPIRSNEGSLAVDGWFAVTFLEGSHLPGRWRDIVAVGERFHHAIADVPRPDFLVDRADPWAIGDRVAWGEVVPDDMPDVKHLRRLMALIQPIEAVPQVIHGDLTGNVLIQSGMPPAVIDLAPYYRDATFATAIVVVDGLVWEGADPSLITDVGSMDTFPQYLLRALIYRVVTDRLFRSDEPVRADEGDPYLPVVELVIAAVTTH